MRNEQAFCGFILFLAMAATGQGDGLSDGTWTFIDVPGMLQTEPFAIDGNTIVGLCNDWSPGHGFVFDGTSYSLIDVPFSGGRGTHVQDIHGAGMVGHYDDGSVSHGFIFDGTTWTTFDVPGASGTFPTDFDGKNVVGSFISSGCYHGFLYDGSDVTAIDFPGASQTQVSGIEGSKIVGSYYDASGRAHGFVHDGVVYTTLDMPGAEDTYLRDIDNGRIVGNYGPAYASHGFIYDGGTWTTIDVPITGCETFVTDIQGNKLVGFYDIPPGVWPNWAHGFMYTLPDPPSITIVIGDCDTGVTNQALPDGTTMADEIVSVGASARNHGEFVKAVARLTNDWQKQGLISGAEKGRIQSCSAKSSIPVR